MTIIDKIRQDLERYPAIDIATIKKYYGLKARERNDLLWQIARQNLLRHQLARMHPGFKVTRLQPGTILYHGTFNRLIGDKPYSPGYLSADILQSAGHLLRDYSEISKAAKENDTERLLTKISKLKCFPMIYKYKTGGVIKLLTITEPHKESSFADLLNVDLLIEMTAGLPQVRAGFITRANSIDIKGEEFNTLLAKYRNNCIASCFGGWTNTPGYYLLGHIDYNQYLRKVGLLSSTESVSGLYIPRDQDEIVLFDTTPLTNAGISYILPYAFIQKNTRQAQQFVDRYLTLTNTTDIVNVAKEYNTVKDNEWNFSWYMSNLADFNPRKSPETGSIRFWINDFEARVAAIEQGIPILSSKLSIEKINELHKELEKYLYAIENQWTNQNLSVPCKETAPIFRSVMYM